ncbi:outer membrane protein assembly factor BamA [Psittacicella melopsittaci]|uniref:Outer membrane protein assembly factor BamA n=1 Tax=Psittacicella melopsittaci TaxID=2028576 RepID=A0A3A1YA97_9GAMM|nr:outer membrane protein assembly factor BamA [Psittacicella melopsittaci]RIY33074.1 outer membrane protein assembly factor BamA [Psittacicella melopsittaci]
MKKFLLTKLMLALSIPALAVSPFQLDSVEVKGVNQSQSQDIIDLLNLKQGATINDNEIAQIIRKLYATGNFNNVSVNKVGNNLVIDLKLKQTIASVNFTGNSLIPTDQIRQTYEQNGIRQGAILNEDTLTQLNEEVERFYQSQGYSQVAVSTRISTLDDGTVNVQVIVDEKKRAYLRTLNIVGNKTFTEKELLSDSTIRPDTRWYNFYHNSNFNSQNKQLLLDNITNYYKDRGYAKFRIVSTQEANLSTEKPQDVTFTVTVDEGALYKVSGISFFSRNTALDEEFKKLNKVVVGNNYNKASVDATVQAIKDYLAGLGYANANIEPVLRFDDANNTLEIVIAVDKGARYTVNTIIFNGNYLTKDEVIRRTLLQQENSIYNLNLVNQDVSTLLRSGNFSDASFRTETVAGTSDLLNLYYDVKETANGSFQIGLGYGSTQGITYTAKLQQNNFLGTGRSVGITAERSSGRLYGAIDYTEPYVTTYGLSLNTSVYYSKINTEKYRRYYGYNYRQTVYGLTLGTSIPVSRYGTLSGSVTYENNKYYNLYPEYYRMLYLQSIGQDIENGRWTVRTRDITFNLSYNLNTYDRYLFPTKGYDFTIGAGITSLASTDKYYSMQASFKTFTPLSNNRNWVLGTRIAAAHAVAMDGKYLPISALYTAGGAGTLRGLSDASVGPASINCSTGSTCTNLSASSFTRVNTYEVVGGDSIVYGGVDLYFPLFRGEVAKSIRTSFFVDTAAVWSTQWKKYTASLDQSILNGYEDWSKPNFRVTTGINLDWQSPLGLLSFYLGTPVVSKSYDDKEIFGINFGTTY